MLKYDSLVSLFQLALSTYGDVDVVVSSAEKSAALLHILHVAP